MRTLTSRRRKLSKRRKFAAIPARIETQGSIGAEDELTAQEIAEADVVLLAVDVKITGEERFKGKPVVRCRTEDVMRNTEGFLKKIEATLKNHR